MTTLFDVMVRVAPLLRPERAGTATGGGATTLADTSVTEPEHYWNGGTIFFQSGNNISKSAVITDYANATGTFTFATPGAACAAGNAYTALGKNYSRTALVNAINQGLFNIGGIIQTDETLTTSAISIALPSGVKNLVRVEFKSGTEYDAPFHQWKELEAYLVFDTAPAIGSTIRLTYIAPHAAVSLDADVINDEIPVDRLVWEAVYAATIHRITQVESQEPFTQDLNKAALEFVVMNQRRQPVRHMNRDPRLSRW
jgi:hypothetical protein